MDHVITVGDVRTVIFVVLGIVVGFGVLVGAIYLMNPFRSGH